MPEIIRLRLDGDERDDQLRYLVERLRRDGARSAVVAVYSDREELTLQQTADRLGYSMARVRRMLDDNELAGTRPRPLRNWAIPLESVLEYERRLRNSPTGP